MTVLGGSLWGSTGCLWRRDRKGGCTDVLPHQQAATGLVVDRQVVIYACCREVDRL